MHLTCNATGTLSVLIQLDLPALSSPLPSAPTILAATDAPGNTSAQSFYLSLARSGPTLDNLQLTLRSGVTTVFLDTSATGMRLGSGWVTVAFLVSNGTASIVVDDGLIRKSATVLLPGFAFPPAPLWVTGSIGYDLTGTMQSRFVGQIRSVTVGQAQSQSTGPSSFGILFDLLVAWLVWFLGTQQSSSPPPPPATRPLDMLASGIGWALNPPCPPGATVPVLMANWTQDLFLVSVNYTAGPVFRARLLDPLR